MSDFNYEFRILIDTENGHKYSYGSSSLVSLPANTSKVVTTEQMIESINTMPSMSYYNAPAFSTGSALYDNPPDVVVDIDRFGASLFGPRTFLDTTLPDGISDGVDVSYQFVSCSIKDNNLSGSILFHSNTTPTNDATGNDTIKRYKFWGNKVCQVLGVPENYWIYSNKFILSNTGSQPNYLSGDVLATSLNLKTNFAINNAGSITSDLPFRHFKEADRYVRWTDISSSIPQNKMLIGYNQHRDEYGIEMPFEEHFIISASAVTASGDFEVGNRLTIKGDIVNQNGNPVIFSNDTGSFHQNISAGPTGLPGATLENSLAAGHITASGNISASGTGSFGNIIIDGKGSVARALNIEGSLSMSGHLHFENEFHMGYYSSGFNLAETGVADYRIFVQTSSGNVGIGTQHTPEKLTVDGHISASGKFKALNESFPQIILSDDGGEDKVNIGQSGGSFYIKTSETSNDIQFRRSDNADVMFLDMSHKRVGINTTSPDEELQVVGDVSASYYWGAQAGYFRVGGADFTANKWLAWGGGVGGAAASLYANMDENDNTDNQLWRCVMPFDGIVQHITLKPQNDAGNTQIRFYKITGDTAADTLDTAGVQVGNTLTLDLSTAGLPQTARWGPGNPGFSRGDILGIKVDPNTDPGQLDGMLVLMFDVQNVPSDHI